MEEKNLKLSIAHLYPKHLNLYGDLGNVITLRKRCEWRGINVDFEEINIGDSIGEHDLYFIVEDISCSGIITSRMIKIN